MLEVLAEKKKYNPMNDEICMKCKDVCLCGGIVYCKDYERYNKTDCEYMKYKIDDYLKYFHEYM